MPAKSWPNSVPPSIVSPRRTVFPSDVMRTSLADPLTFVPGGQTITRPTPVRPMKPTHRPPTRSRRPETPTPVDTSFPRETSLPSTTTTTLPTLTNRFLSNCLIQKTVTTAQTAVVLATRTRDLRDTFGPYRRGQQIYRISAC